MIATCKRRQVAIIGLRDARGLREAPQAAVPAVG
jgi:hypothetical protein